MADIVQSKFPLESLVPKCETGVLNFLQKYPQYDGRDVTIAIFDSGVDPRASGLKSLKEGSTKVIKRFDCSGCGDTDTSTKVSLDSDGRLLGLSGKLLKATSYMKENNKNGSEFRVGLKSFYDLYPSKIREKAILDAKIKNWDEPQKRAIAEVTRELSALEQQTTSAQTVSPKDKIKKENFENSLEFLNNCEKKFADMKTSYDVVLFDTRDCWRAVVDTSGDGNLEQGVCIGEYSQTHELMNVQELLSVSINVHDDGNVLEFVGMCSSHGTHVAAIASANHSEGELDGVAPNAKVISLTIGDGRLGSMETGTALVRAIIKVMELCRDGTKIDVINMSYGEHAHWSNSGRIGELMNEVVNKYGVIWVASAGNHGPALCTVGTPPDISQPSCIGVGAYISPKMMEAEYALREKLPANVYTWSSRDPCVDGGQGVTVCAPGAAITSVPEFTMSRAQLMNGTSMASPHVAGAVALLVSGLKQKGVVYTPYSVKRAIWNTATKLSYVDEFAQGSGLLNVEKAFEHLIQYSMCPENIVRFSVKIGNQNAKGIHLRQGILSKPVEKNVSIEPLMIDDKSASLKDKVNFNVRLTLVPSEPWVQCGGFLDLCYGSRSISVRVDPTGLQPGVHTAKVNVYDSSCIEKGTLFEIPVTVIQPNVLDVEKTRTITSNSIIQFKPNTIKRLFVLVPPNATWAVLKMISVDDNESHCGKFFVHTMQILPMKYCKALETMKILPVGNDVETTHAFKCEKNNILEVCIAKYWSNFGEMNIKYSLEFHGITTNALSMMHAANGVHRIDITTLGPEEISPAVQFKTATIVLKPVDSKISPLSATRDVIPQGRQIYQNLLTYNLHVAKGQEVAIYAPIFYSVLYESEYESQFWMLYDCNKMMVTCGDAYSNTTYTKLEKGDYTIRLQVRHEKKDILEKISEATMLAVFKLLSPISMDIYEHYNQCVTGGKKVNSFALKGNSSKTLFISPLTSEKLSKSSVPMHCSWLNGAVVFVKDDIGRKCDNNTFQYILTEGPPTTKPNSSPRKNSNKQTKEEYRDALRDYQCSNITKLDLETAEEVYKDVLNMHPKHLPLHLALIQSIDCSEGKCLFPYAFINLLKNDSMAEKLDVGKLSKSLSRIMELASIIINETDIEALLAFYGIKTDSRSDAAKIKSNMDKQKVTLLEAYVKKGIATCKLFVMDSEKSVSDGTNVCEDIDTIYSQISKFVDPADMKVIAFSAWHAYIHNHFGRMAKYLQKMYEEKLSKDILEELQHLSKAKKWYHVAEMLKRFIVTAYPSDYRSF